jgi:hypothetical protein
MTRALAIIAAARADFLQNREPESVDRRTDLACLVGIIVIIQVGMVLAGYQEKLP